MEIYFSEHIIVSVFIKGVEFSKRKQTTLHFRNETQPNLNIINNSDCNLFDEEHEPIVYCNDLVWYFSIYQSGAGRFRWINSYTHAIYYK